MRKIKFSNSTFIVRFITEKVCIITLETTFIFICHDLYTESTTDRSLKNCLSTSTVDPIPGIFRQLQKTVLVQVDSCLSYSRQDCKVFPIEAKDLFPSHCIGWRLHHGKITRKNQLYLTHLRLNLLFKTTGNGELQPVY